jgi:hypothetical protein
VSLWKPSDSDDLDRRTKAMRQAAVPLKPPPPNKGVNTSNYRGLPRGEATREELQRRKAMERAMRRRSQREGEQ